MKYYLILAIFIFLSYFNNPNQLFASDNEKYTLEPSEQSIKIPVSLPYSGYGINVLLKQNDQIVLDQRDVSYQWTYNNKYINLLDTGFNSGCPYNINSPCNNLHANLQGVVPGNLEVNVIAIKNGATIASTSFKVEVSDDSYTLESSEQNITFDQGTDYGVNVLFKKDGYLILDQQNVSYVWKSHNQNMVTVYDRGFENGCPYDLVAPCPNMNAILSGKGGGKTKIEVEVWIGKTLIEVTYIDVEVKGESQPVLTTPKKPTSPPTIKPVQVIPEPTVQTNPNNTENIDNNYEGERLLRIEKSLAELNNKVEKQENILQKILSFFKRLFGGN
ncbi:hypothetical protein COX08_00495 [Candidatus Beckwithbacteria bacterium CG23_combo_of_CG06-09_8_20_14_all_34_8]|uniref:Uncharacterized protein n=1 Tax=Candidatus Beckwithbacteria bacterium CG23_combo_of_CG06-09_8_20_14_all_34_8 TaxID=1974497 RepID=A0A2H0B7D4_9BACT|nr:MAG: hypothetical protein COX08_00495 [Candidatus Beckwithbacteria bacterium CG23_combo_of_CG06-09_8_20_14_all_34_8]